MLKLVFRVVLGGLITFSGVAFSQDNASSKQRGLEPPPATIKQQSAMEIGAMFERPTSVPQLLQNLKLAMDKDLLLQRAFFDDANLKKFFNGTKVTWEKPDPLHNPYEKHKSHVEVTIDNSVFSKMVVKLIDNRWQDSRYDKSTGAYVPGRKRVSGTLSLQVEGVPTFTSAEVTRIFGLHATKSIDYGEDTDGHFHIPTTKGWFVYEARWNRTLEPYFEKSARFFFKLNPLRDSPTPDTSGPKSMPLRPTFTDNDVVESIALYEVE